ncbi:hypothetical protein HQ529_02865 [Candidatus Woesearchaeota archaeon]|nr:hypothetical protein [Candidatus Woesearchaeota archaeon]
MVKITEEEYLIISKTIIKKLYSVRAWGKGHLLIERFKSGLPSHYKGDVDYVVKDLMKKEIILPYGKTKHGFAVYLNKNKIKEILQILEENYSSIFGS